MNTNRKKIESPEFIHTTVIVQLKSNNATKRSMGWMLGVCGTGQRIYTNTRYDKWRVRLIAGAN